ncbi:MAG: hypothetical protein AB1422_14405 [bacterium]
MENLDDKEEIEIIGRKDEEYEIPKGRYRLFEWSVKLVCLGVGIFITTLLYNKCLFNQNCNIIISVYFALLGLTFFSAAGLPVDKVVNIKWT